MAGEKPSLAQDSHSSDIESDIGGDQKEDSPRVDETHWMDAGTLKLPYIPDFRVDDLIFYLVPDIDNAKEAYHTLPAKTLDRWSAYFTKKGWKFLQTAAKHNAVGPVKIRPGKTRIEVLEPGRLFAPKPCLCLGPGADEIPLVSFEKRRPFDPWKPTYIRALNFIKKYKPIQPISRAVEYALWEVEECGEVAGSVSWENGERILSEWAAKDAGVRDVLADVFTKRPEDFPLGSEVYLRVLGKSGKEGFEQLCELHKHPQLLKRCHVAKGLGELGDQKGIDVLLRLLEDENSEVRNSALQAIGKAGVPTGHRARERLQEFLESSEISHKVWITEALLRGGDPSQEKVLIQMVKETPLPLIDMGELGQILVDLKMVQAVPFLIKRLKSDRVEMRDDAAETLRGLTGLDLEFHGHDPLEERRASVRQWQRWWEEFKRTRGSQRK